MVEGNRPRARRKLEVVKILRSSLPSGTRESINPDQNPNPTSNQPTPRETPQPPAAIDVPIGGRTRTWQREPII